MTAPVPLRGPRATEAESVREGAALEGLEADLRGYLERLRATQDRAAAELGLRELPGVLARLFEHDDAAWWLTHRGLFRPLTSERRYEDYPAALWTRLFRDFAGGRRAGAEAMASGARLAAEDVPLAAHDALAPVLPNGAESLKKSGHREFLVAKDRVVAVHERGARLFGDAGKVIAKNLPKGQGGVTRAVIDEDARFVLLGNVPWGLHRLDLGTRALDTFPVPTGIGERGFCLVSGGVAIMDPAPAVVVSRLGERGLEPLHRAEHPELRAHAALERVSGTPELLFARCLGDAGESWTLCATWDGTTLSWIDRLGFPVWTPRLAADGSIIARVDLQRAVRLRLG